MQIKPAFINASEKKRLLFRIGGKLHTPQKLFQVTIISLSPLKHWTLFSKYNFSKAIWEQLY